MRSCFHQGSGLGQTFQVLLFFKTVFYARTTSMFGFPMIMSSSLARVSATVKRLGSKSSPRWRRWSSARNLSDERTVEMITTRLQHIHFFISPKSNEISRVDPRTFPHLVDSPHRPHPLLQDPSLSTPPGYSTLVP